MVLARVDNQLQSFRFPYTRSGLIPGIFLPHFALHTQVRLRDSAEIIVLGPYLCTQIWVRAIISLFKMPLSICQSRRKEIRNALAVIRWVRWVPSSQNMDTGAASQTLLTEVNVCYKGYTRLWKGTEYIPAPLNQSCLFLRLLTFPARRGQSETMSDWWRSARDHGERAVSEAKTKANQLDEIHTTLKFTTRRKFRFPVSL